MLLLGALMGKFRDQQVLVTGAEGFIGSHLVERLVAAGARVRALSQYNSFNNWGRLEDLPCLHQIEVVSGDIRDPHFCYDLTRGIAVVFHLAALIPIPYSSRGPTAMWDTNIKAHCTYAKRRGIMGYVASSQRRQARCTAL